MGNRLTALLVVSNIATAAILFHYYERDQISSQNRTTDTERTQFGKACLDWISEQSKKSTASNDTEDQKLWLGRSWRKHGQMVFEVFSDPDTLPKDRVDVLCTYDLQSGTMFAYEGTQREMWMFY